MTVWVMHCTHCREERDFEQPPCGEGHGVDCPDLACIECGMAVVLPGSQTFVTEPGVTVELRAAG